MRQSLSRSLRGPATRRLSNPRWLTGFSGESYSHTPFLNRANLARADLSGADLYSAHFFGAVLTNALLNGSNMASADFSHSRLVDASICPAMNTAVPSLMNGQPAPAQLADAKFYSATMDRVRLEGADLKKAKFDNAVMPGAVLRGATMNEETSMRHVDLSHSADLSYVDAPKADFSAHIANGRPDPAQRTLLIGANLSHSDFSGAKFASADLSEADFSGSNLSDVDLSSADLQRAKLSNALPLQDQVSRRHDRDAGLRCNLAKGGGSTAAVPAVHARRRQLIKASSAASQTRAAILHPERREANRPTLCSRRGATTYLRLCLRPTGDVEQQRVRRNDEERHRSGQRTQAFGHRVSEISGRRPA